ncbi:chemotaxis protein [Photobacterium aquae]|uniref:Chemotaxis protein n=1 Tax=Photobacterium aquae TaxID=1195763 RepID=A0A0J1H254_9GAMM|nr:HAMP domain-containing methyl-accepting chemotaxis protein [Photobacterium aquae]KLV05863.1 chemotaxis protein [Photobacterium aquae]
MHSVKHKLYAGFLSVLMIMVLTVIISAYEVYHSHRIANEVRLDDTPGLQLYTSLIDDAGDIHRDALLSISGYNNALTSYEQNKAQFLDAYDLLQPLEKSNPTDARRLERIKQYFIEFTTQFEQKIVPALNITPSAQLFIQLKHIEKKTLIELENELDIATSAERKEAEQGLNFLADSLETIEQTMLWMTLFAFSTGCLIAYLLARSITSRLESLNHIAQQVAAGNPSLPPLTISGNDELTTLGNSISQMQNSLVSLISAIASVSNDIQSTTTTLTEASRHIVEGTAQQAEKANLIATASEELTLTITEVAEQTHTTAEHAQQSELAAVDGRSTIVTMVDSIQRVSVQMQAMSTNIEQLDANSEKIGSVIRVIEDIAAQTNLLALNAAIEAARAGEFGRGFAVVADEVRALAERTTKATQEVAGIIQTIQTGMAEAVSYTSDSCQQVENGVNESHGAVAALEQIVTSTSQVQGMINTIATATEEQSAVTREIATDITFINDIASRSLDLSKDSDSAVTQLEQKVTDLDQLISRFKLN